MHLLYDCRLERCLVGWAHIRELAIIVFHLGAWLNGIESLRTVQCVSDLVFSRCDSTRLHCDWLLLRQRYGEHYLALVSRELIFKNTNRCFCLRLCKFEAFQSILVDISKTHDISKQITFGCCFSPDAVRFQSRYWSDHFTSHCRTCLPFPWSAKLPNFHEITLKQATHLKVMKWILLNTMDKAESRNASDGTHLAPPQLPSIKVEDLRSWSPSRYSYESAGARSTRMIIESSSYQTTPCNSPPPESFQNPHDEQSIDADYISQKISQQRERRSCTNNRSQSIHVGSTNNNRRVQIGETRPCNLAATKELLRRNSLDERPGENNKALHHETAVPAKVSGQMES
jgi:hypothetical protein